MTEALKPSELFGLRWRSLDDQNALPLYRNGVAANFNILKISGIRAGPSAMSPLTEATV